MSANRFGIDVETHDKRNVLRYLNRLVSTVSATDGGEYREDRQFSQVHVVTTKTKEQFEAWCDRVSLGIVGVFDLDTEPQACNAFGFDERTTK